MGCGGGAMMSSQNPNWSEWMDDFVTDWRLEHEASDEFWSFIQELLPMQARLIRESFDSAVKRAYEAGRG